MCSWWRHRRRPALVEGAERWWAARVSVRHQGSIAADAVGRHGSYSHGTVLTLMARFRPQYYSSTRISGTSSCPLVSRAPAGGDARHRFPPSAHCWLGKLHPASPTSRPCKRHPKDWRGRNTLASSGLGRRCGGGGEQRCVDPPGVDMHTSGSSRPARKATLMRLHEHTVTGTRQVWAASASSQVPSVCSLVATLVHASVRAAKLSHGLGGVDTLAAPSGPVVCVGGQHTLTA